MEIPLSRLLLDDPRLLQQVVQDDATHRICLEIEFDVHELAKSAGIVVPVGFGVSKRLQNGIALQQHILDSFNFIVTLLVRDCGNVLHDNLGGLRFPRSRLPRNHYASVPVSLLHRSVRGIGNRKQMWGILKQFPACKIEIIIKKSGERE